MAICRLKVSNVRNLSVSVAPSPKVNLFFGENGSGKTSLLESVCFLAIAKSFRTNKLKPVVRNGCRSCTVFGEVLATNYMVSVGVTRSLDHQPLIHLNGRSSGSVVDLAFILPVQLMHPKLFTCLEDGPQIRRRLMDWGVFHQFPIFWSAWKKMQTSLKQRNKLLKYCVNREKELKAWTQTFIDSALIVDKLRSDYMSLLVPELEALLQMMTGLAGIRLVYCRGWSKGVALEDALSRDIDKDKLSGFTYSGPQRADIKLTYNGASVVETLSRGQQKIVVCAIKLAQGKLFERLKKRACVYLIDDLLSELDEKNCALLVSVLNEMQSQVWVTGVDENALRKTFLSSEEKKVFHVKHGRLCSV